MRGGGVRRLPHEVERNSPTWWLGLIHTGSGPVRTKRRHPYLQQAADLRLEAMHQRVRFGRDLLAKELEEAATTIEDMAKLLEAKEDEKG